MNTHYPSPLSQQIQDLADKVFNIKKTEIWVDVVGFEGVYQVSNEGRVKSIDRTVIFKNGASKRVAGCVMSLYKGNHGYMTVNFHVNAKSITKLVHRLVAEAFIGPSDLQVDHEDADRTNNNLSNLSYKTTSDNILKSFVQTRNKTSKYPYVHYHITKDRWVAVEPITNKNIGTFKAEEDAYKAYLNHIKIA